MVKSSQDTYNYNPTKFTFAVNSRDAKLSSLYGNVLYKPSEEANLELLDEINHRMKVDHIFDKITNGAITAALKSNSNEEFPLPRNFGCLRNLVEHFT
jgi:hypothetical protein